jgi:hypothetical protein
MKSISWNVSKSNRLKQTRGVSFEEIIRARLIAIDKHPKKTHQNVMLFLHKRYIWIVPFIMKGEEIFLKTLYPSRKYTKLFKKGGVG